ncbi:nuclear transport factor 2 family protein [Massilia sp. DD77]|uniref:nuclear transport factor 2 family protein n=1 Tax=Massilia sp. DD77 TaxID=3109349 RepID=UPI002FFE4160
MSTEVEALKQFYAAINRNDMQAISKDFDPDILRIEPPGFPTAGTYRGIEAVREHVRAGRETWAEGSCDPEAFFAKGDKVVVFAYAWVRLKDATDWIGGRFADGFVFHDGLIVEYRTFVERDEALGWAGIDKPAPNRVARKRSLSKVHR